MSQRARGAILVFAAFVPLVWCMARPSHVATRDEVLQAVEAG